MCVAGSQKLCVAVFLGPALGAADFRMLSVEGYQNLGVAVLVFLRRFVYWNRWNLGVADFSSSPVAVFSSCFVAECVWKKKMWSVSEAQNRRRVDAEECLCLCVWV